MEKYVWGRVGLSFRLTTEEFHTLSAGGYEAEELIRAKLAEGRFLPDGETYFGPDGNGSEGHWRPDDEIALDL